MTGYKALKKQVFITGDYSLVPIRMEDRYDIMKWRNEQIYHLRQVKPLTKDDQDTYFDTVVAELFDKEQPEQILFSYLRDGKCIGYGGLVHINWRDQNAEISFIMDTVLEEQDFELQWKTFLKLIKQVAFSELWLHKIYTFAFDLRPRLYRALEEAAFKEEARLKEHYFFDRNYIDVVIHSNIGPSYLFRHATEADEELTYTWANDHNVRKYSFQQQKIELAEHRKWFNRKVHDPNCVYYILENSETAIGSIRFDIESSGTALISYLVDPQYHGRGYGEIILREGILNLAKEHKDIKSVCGVVLSNNIPSIRIFEKLGFRNISEKEGEYKFEKLLTE